MVTRKPVGPPLNTSKPATGSNDGRPPYPATPIDSSKIPASVNSIYSPDLSNSPAFDLIGMEEARRRPQRRDSDVSSHGTWDSDDDEDKRTPEESDIPQPLRITPSKQKLQEEHSKDEQKDELPSILRPGPANGAPQPRTSQESQRYAQDTQANPWASEQQSQSTPPNGRFESNNPYLRNQATGENSKSTWSQPAHPAPPSNAPPAPPVELPTVRTPADEMSKMSFNAPSREEPFHTAEVLPVPNVGQAPLPPVKDSRESDALSNPWAASNPTPDEKWADIPIAPPPGPPPGHQQSLMDDDRPMSSQHTTQFDGPSSHQSTLTSPPHIPKPAPAPIATSAQPLPARSTNSIPVPETPGTQAKRQKNEHYQIKHINWWDQSYAADPRMRSGMRESPILTQNANGPCPLLALVNALVLSTPQNVDTALIETLRTREQVSLGLLLDAVFDELMSGRRGETAQELPDVSELYSFLLALHTGMNVNPRFVTPVTTPRGSLDGHAPDMGNVHPTIRAQTKAGCFEETKEMRLYSTFGVPLVHGWVPPKDTPAYEAFNRSAPSFEDAQNIQFAEPELEDKLRSEGLSHNEQQTLQDIHTIKLFLSNWPTQLTDYGLQSISRTLRPGQIAILFRNDHFSTIYKEPKHGGLMTLVTDAGYGSHAEIVWESLVDVNGAASEMFSGDFRVVSHQQDARLNQGNSAGGEDGWQTVQTSNSNSRNQEGPLRVTDNASPSEGPPPPLPGPRPTSRLDTTAHPDAALTAPDERHRTASEQEDHDLALALQLQEEEEDQQRQAEQQRRREQELSEQFLSRENEGRPPVIPPRRGAGRGTGAPTTSTSTPTARPPVNRPSNATSDPDAPPTYEQSSSDRPYREAGSTAPPAQGSPLNAYDALRAQEQRQQQQSAYAQQSGSVVGGPNGFGHGRRQSQGNRMRRRSSQPGTMPGGYNVAGPSNPAGRGRPQPGTVQEAEDKCSVM